jgi:plasmid maintenance system antidote protein VapI
MAAQPIDNARNVAHNNGMSAKRANPFDLAEQLRRAIHESGLSPYRVATDAGVDRAVLSRFLRGERGLNLDTASRICELLELRLVKGG